MNFVKEKQTMLPQLVDDSGYSKALPRYLSLPCAFVAILISILVLAGWIWQIDGVKEFFGSPVPMKPNTAVALFLLGCCVVLSHFDRVGSRCAVYVFASITLLLGLLTDIEYLTGADFGIDNILIYDNTPVFGNLRPGRMAPNTAFSFLLLGLSILIGGKTPARCAVSQGLIFLVLIIGILSLFGQLFGAYKNTPPLWNTMATETAISIVAVGLGLLLRAPHQGPLAVFTNPYIAGVLLRRALPVAIFVPPLIAATRIRGEAAGFYGREFGAALTSTSTVVVAVVILWLIGRWLEDADARRRDAELEKQRLSRQLEDYACRLEETVALRTADLRSSEERLHHALSASSMGTWSWDIETDTMRLDEFAFPLLGREQGSIGSSLQDFLGLLTASSRQATERALQNALRQKGKLDTEFCVAWSDGTTRVLSARGQIICNEKGQAMRLVGACWDITAQKAVETQLRNTAQLLDAVIEHIPNMIFLKHAADLRFAMLNKAGEDLLGYSRGDLIGKNDYDFFTPEQADFFTSRDRAVLQSGYEEIFEEPIDTRLNGRRLLHTKKIALRDELGNPRYLLGISDDITERKKSEEEISKLNTILERRVVELDAANSELESFAYAVSHDLRAPLRAMSGFSHALLEDFYAELPPQARKFVDRISNSSKQMGELIDGLLALSRSTQGEMIWKSVDLTAMANRIRDEQMRLDPTRNIDWQIENGIIVSGDERMLDAALRNLLDNACKYTANVERPVIRFYTEQRNGVKYFCVADNGAGFSMEHSSRLFKPFQRLHRQDEFKGIGIGLATVQRIFSRHGGSIDAHADVDCGATFCFTIGAQPHQKIE